MYKVNLKLIKQKRELKGYSLKEMANLMGFNDKAKYYRREAGEYNFKPEELPQIAKILNIPISKIFTLEVSKKETLTNDKEIAK